MSEGGERSTLPRQVLRVLWRLVFRSRCSSASAYGRAALVREA